MAQTPEQRTRELVAAIHAEVTPTTVQSPEEIRAAALAHFTSALDAKLKNLQDGETLLLTYRVDIQTADGAIRRGAGDDRNMPEYAEWRTVVYERDHYCCQDCGATGALNAHHILPWSTHPEARFQVENGITLCPTCHAARHPHLRFMQRGSA